MSDARYFIRADGRIKGPFALPDLQRLVGRGLLLPEHEVSNDRVSWVEAGRYETLFPQADPAMQSARPTPAPARSQPAPTAPRYSAAPARRGAATISSIPRPAQVSPPIAGGRTLTVGRDPSCDVVIDSLAFNRRHFALTLAGDGNAAIADLASTSGTFLNGRRVAGSMPIRKGDRVTAGGVQFTFDGQTLLARPPDLGFEVRVAGLGRQVTDRGSGKPRMLIRDIDMVLKPGEFVALVGASGAGKSTLFGALSGRVRATHGQVLFDGQDLYENFEAFRGYIGYVPQRDVFHDALPVADALRATSRLRLSKDTTPAEIDANIDRVLKIVGLSEKRQQVIANLSGGEQKRVAIALELLSRPRILFLDEPTAPLDPRTTTRMMELFRTLAEGGITVIMITHAANSLAHCDTVAYMHKGLLTFFGPPALIKDFFGVTDMGDAYAAEEHRAPEQWLAAFRASPECQSFLASRDMQAGDAPPAAVLNRKASKHATSGGGWWHQTTVLTRRYVRLLTIDKRTLAIMVLLAPLVAFMLCLAVSSIDVKSGVHDFNYHLKQKQLVFGCVVIVMFLSLFGSVREIVKELPIYLHEHFVNVEVIPYLLSKMIPLLVIDAVQTALVVAVIWRFGGLEAGGPALQFAILFLCSAVGTMLGLMISALVSQSDRAVTGMIIIVIPEILFSGAFIPMKGAAKLISGPLVTAYWGFNGLMSKLPHHQPQDDFASTPKSIAMLLVHFTAATLITYLLLVLKDATQILERMLTQPARKRRRRAPGAATPAPPQFEASAP